ncbi:MAG TPA: hypothetical protein VMO78_09375 [Rhizomicrobium sp.]|nr:hypothetical protein [Rhizomicrobium sp.]
MKHLVLLGALLAATAAAAQPVQPMPTASMPVSDILASAPHRDISNVLITARVATPNGTSGFYRGTRFDQTGVITSLKLNGREFYGPWFDATAPEVLDYTYDASGQLVAGPDSAISGPVEEFAPIDFTPTPGSHFVKIGVGILYQPDSAPYDHYRHYKILDGGQRVTRITPRSSTFIQTVNDAGIAYVYTKTLELVPGRTQLVISHSLQNTGKTAINTTVYDHNFLRLKSGDDAIRISFPFPIAAADPPPDGLMRIWGNMLTYLRPMKPKERISFPVTGFGAGAQDYDFRVTDTSTGASVHVTGDQPLTRVNIFSIDKVQSVEPTIAIDLAPGREKRWTYRYTFTAPKS